MVTKLTQLHTSLGLLSDWPVSYSNVATDGPYLKHTKLGFAAEDFEGAGGLRLAGWHSILKWIRLCK